MPHVLSNLEEKILLAKYDFRVKLFEEKLDLLKEMARGHAREDFEDWLYEIINMKVALPESPIEKDTYKLQAMGRSLAMRASS